MRLHAALRPKRRIARWTCLTSAGLVFLAVVAAAAFYLRLRQGPIDLAFLTPRIKAAIDRELADGIRLQIGGVVLEQGGGTGLTVRLRDLSLVDREGDPLAVISRAEVGLDPLALISGEIAPRRVRLLNPRLHVERGATGRLVITPDAPSPVAVSKSLREGAEADMTPPPVPLDRAALSGVMQSFAAAVEDLLSLAGDPESHLEAISLRNGEVSYQWGGALRRLENVSITLERGLGDGPVKLNIEAGQGAQRIALSLSAARDGIGMEGRKKVVLTLHEVPQVPVRLDESPASGLDRLLIPVRAQAVIMLGPDGAVLEAQGRVQVTARQDEPDARPVLRDGDLIFRFDPAAGRLVLEPSRFALGRGDGTISGVFDWPQSGDVARDGIIFAVETQDLFLAANDVDAPPLPVERAALSGALLPAQNAVRLDSIAISAGEAKIAGKGVLTLGRDSPGLQIEVSTSSMEVNALKQLWPAFIAPGARNWVVANVETGRVDPARFTADYAPDALHRAKMEGVRLADDALDLTFAMRDVSFRYFRNFPPVTGLRAVATLNGNAFQVKASAGEIASAQAGGISIRSGLFEVPMIHGEGVTGKVNVALAGRTQTLVDIMRGDTGLDMPQTVKSLDKVSGDARLDLAIEMRMRPGLTKDDVIYLVGAEFDDLSLPQIFAKRSFDKGSVRLQIAPQDYRISAKGLLDGAPATIELRSDKPPSQSDFGNFAVSLLIDEKSGLRFGLGIGEILTGPVLARIEGEGSLETVGKVALDITNARLAADGFGTLKPAGRKGEVSFRPAFGPSGKTLRDFELLTDDLALKGMIGFAANGEFQSADFTQVRMGRGDGVSLTVRKQAAGMHTTIKGRSFDLGPLIRSTEPGASNSSTANAAGGGNAQGRSLSSLNIEVERLLGLGGEEIRSANFRIASRGQMIMSLEGSGRFTSGGQLKGSIESNARGRVLTVNATDAGALFRFFDFYQKAQGGQLVLRARLPAKPDHAMPGILEVKDFRVMDDPGLKKLAAQTGNVEGRQLANGGGAMAFDRLYIVFQRTTGKTSISEGVIRGPAAGATFSGTIDHRAAELNLTGTFVPVYALNNMFSRIPLFGPLLGGRADEGLVGVTFAMRGKMSNPNLMVNPLSAIAPGLFRRIFEFGQHPVTAAPLPASPAQ